MSHIVCVCVFIYLSINHQTKVDKELKLHENIHTPHVINNKRKKNWIPPTKKNFIICRGKTDVFYNKQGKLATSTSSSCPRFFTNYYIPFHHNTLPRPRWFNCLHLLGHFDLHDYIYLYYHPQNAKIHKNPIIFLFWGVIFMFQVPRASN